ncbi:hypothetical protein ABEB36_007547 [Hypothenemus hampei]|uniref:Uncharacterized protein n=1 Tax=Hypothenemus hampei TaxID=57062 RepID=A0ABD1EYD1_HYPHA
MKYFLYFAVVAVLAFSNAYSATIPQTVFSRGDVTENSNTEELEKQQNIAAKYEFSSDIEDHISDLTHQRAEQRNGLTVKGVYSYSDGHYKRTVHYEADENGYRIVGTEAVPLDGPHVDLTGTASVQTEFNGKGLAYKIQSVPIEGSKVSNVVSEDNLIRFIALE